MTVEQLPPKYEDPERPSTLEEALDILSLTVKHDRTNKAINFLAMLLAQTNEDQFNIGQEASASSGKTYIGQELSAYYPTRDVRTYAGASPTSFFHSMGESKPLVELEKEEDLSRIFDQDELNREREANHKYEEDLAKAQTQGKTLTRDPRRRVIYINLEHKIVLFLDQPHWQLMERLRPLLSHDQQLLRFDITDKTGKGGLRTKTVIIKGYCVIIFATAKSSREEQEQTRLWLLSPETSQVKLKEALKLLGFRIGTRAAFKEFIENDPGRRWLRARIAAIRDTGIRDVIIPDQDKILEEYLRERPYLAPRASRDWPRLLYLIKGSALYNAFQRKRSGDSIYATEEDKHAALPLYTEVARSNEHGVSPETYMIYESVLVPLTTNGDKVDRKAIQQKYFEIYHRLLPPDRLRKETLPALESAGLIGQEPDPQDKRRTLVWCTITPPISAGISNGSIHSQDRQLPEQYRGNNSAPSISATENSGSNGAPVNVDERFESVELLHPHVKRGLQTPTEAEPDDDQSPLVTRFVCAGDGDCDYATTIRGEAESHEHGTVFVNLSPKLAAPSELGSMGDADVQDGENASDSEGSNNHNPIITKNSLRLDPTLIEEYILKTIVPQEMQRVGYAVEPKIIYAIRQRFGDAAAPLVPGLLTDFAKSRKLEEKPREGCWRLV